jgi:hypothetical protein
MTHTRKTIRPNDYAFRFGRLDKEGFRAMPRIVARKPRTGDIHPLTRNTIWNYLQLVPPAYVYGLKAVELRPRKDAVGCPYGLYSPVEKRIWLYSCPSREWHFSNEIWTRHKGVLASGAQVVTSGNASNDVVVEWNDPFDIELLFVDVLLHELGHHYVNQYRSSRGAPATRSRAEAVANVHVGKLWRRIIANVDRIERRRAERSGA